VEVQGSAWREAFSNPVLARLILAYFFLTVGFSIMTGMFALFTKDRLGFTEVQNGYVFAFIGVVAALIQGKLIGGLVKRFGEHALAITGAILVAMGLAGLPFISSVWNLLPVCALLAAGNSLMMPTLSALASKQATARGQGRVLGVMQSSGSLARFLGPLIGGALYAFSLVGAPSGFVPFIFGALMVLIAGGFARFAKPA
jgi:DHA1 family tetracycline resistance protein-like MFS transporter